MINVESSCNDHERKNRSRKKNPNFVGDDSEFSVNEYTSYVNQLFDIFILH